MIPENLLPCTFLDLQRFDSGAMGPHNSHDKLCHHFRMSRFPILVMHLARLSHFCLCAPYGLLAHSRKCLGYGALEIGLIKSASIQRFGRSRKYALETASCAHDIFVARKKLKGFHIDGVVGSCQQYGGILLPNMNGKNLTCDLVRYPFEKQCTSGKYLLCPTHVRLSSTASHSILPQCPKQLGEIASLI